MALNYMVTFCVLLIMQLLWANTKTKVKPDKADKL